MKILLFAVAGVLAAAPSVRLEPALITACQNGFGKAKVIWDVEGEGPVKLYAGNAEMTGWEPLSGSASTEWWVADGLVFSVRNGAGQTLGSERAAVRCGSDEWWPLAVGNEWYFRVTSSSVTGDHSMWRIARKERVNNVDWFVLEPGPADFRRVRTDAGGRIYQLTDDGVESLLLDPSGVEQGEWTIRERMTETVTIAGTFSEGLTWWRRPFGERSGGFARGVGPTGYGVSFNVGGPSYGAFSGTALIEAIIDGARVVPNYPRVELVLESQLVDFGAKSARNCRVIGRSNGGGVADPVTAYRPCMEASVRGSGRLALLDPSGIPVFQTAADGWVRIPLHFPSGAGTPIRLLPPGKYSVTATVNGATVSLPLEIR